MVQSPPVISVIIPIYNVEPYVAECLESVIGQSFSALEILCVDDCGQDGSIAIAERYAAKDKRVRIIQHAENKGLGEARNTGLDEAKGTYIFFLDSDDYIELDALEKLYGEASNTDKPDLVFSKTRAFLSGWEGPEAESYKANHDQFFQDKGKPAKAKITADNIITFLDITAPSSWGILIKQRFLHDKAIHFARANIIHEDLNFFIKLLLNRPYIIKSSILCVNYRLRPGSIMTTKKHFKSTYDYNTAVKNALTYYNNHKHSLIQLNKKQKKILFKKKKLLSFGAFRRWVRSFFK